MHWYSLKGYVYIIDHMKRCNKDHFSYLTLFPLYVTMFQPSPLTCTLHLSVSSSL